MQGNEVKPQEGCDNGQNRDKKKGFSMDMTEDKSRVQGNEVNPQEVCDEYQHRDKRNSFSMKMVEDQTPPAG